MPRFPTSIHYLGMARLFGHHFVLRGLHDPAEVEAIARGFGELPQNERDALVNERKQHKEVVIFLHEWGHTLGAIHERSPSSIMNPSYAATQSHFGDADARLVEVALAGRDDPRGALVRAIESTRESDWDPGDRDEALRELRGGVRARAPTSAAGPRDKSFDECWSAYERKDARDRAASVERACRAAAAHDPSDPRPLLAIAEPLLDA